VAGGTVAGGMVTRGTVTGGTVFVSPTAGKDSNDGSRAHPFQTLARAQLAVQAGASVVNLLPGTYPRATPLELTHADSGSKWVATGGPGTVTISGGLPVPPASLLSVTDPRILAQLPPSARGRVVQVNLTELGVTDLGTFTVVGSLNGNACLVVDRLRDHGLEVFFGDTAAVFARYACRACPPRSCRRISKLYRSLYHSFLHPFATNS